MKRNCNKPDSNKKTAKNPTKKPKNNDPVWFRSRLLSDEDLDFSNFYNVHPKSFKLSQFKP